MCAEDVDRRLSGWVGCEIWGAFLGPRIMLSTAVLKLSLAKSSFTWTVKNEKKYYLLF